MTVFEKNPRIQVGVYFSPWGLLLWPWFHAKHGQSNLRYSSSLRRWEKIQVSCLVTPQGCSPGGTQAG